MTTDLTLYAQWRYSPSVVPPDPVYYGTISFNANGGTGTMGSVKAQSGTTITLPANTFTREGYTFTEWNTKPDGSGLRYADKSFATVSNFALYAQWKEEEPEPEPVIPEPDDPSAGKEPVGDPIITTDHDPFTGAEITTTTVENTDGSTTTKEDTKLPDGATEKKVRVEEQNGDYAETIVQKDKDGNVTETVVESKVTDETAGTITTKSETTTAEGSVTGERVDKTDGTGDYSAKSETKDADGNVIESSESSQTTDADKTVTTIEKTVIDGVTTESKEVVKADGSGSVETKVSDGKGNASEGTVTKAAGGVVTGLTDKTNEGGVTTEQAFSGSTNGMTLETFLTNEQAAEISDMVLGADGNLYPVTGIGDEVFQDSSFTSLTFDEGITDFGKECFLNASDLKELNIGAISNNNSKTKMVPTKAKKPKIKLGKNCLKGTPKNLKIYVATKKDKKSVKK